MGGNLFKLGRLPRNEYLEIEQELRNYLDKKLGEHYRIPRYYADKPDFGDVDIIISAAAITHNWEEFKQDLIHDLSLKQYKSAGAVFSTVYRNFQVDYFVRKAEFFESTYHFLSFNDIGNLIGKIFKRFNLKYGELGLNYVFRRADNHYVRDIPVSTDFKQIFRFLQLDYAKWQQGFDSKKEMFDWVVACPYFSVVPYQKMSKTLEKRVKERPTIQAFMQYLEDHHIQKTYNFLDKDAYLPIISAFFPNSNLIKEIEREKQREAYVNVIREKYNGRIIMELIPELKGKALGTFINDFQNQFEDHEAYLYQTSAAEIQQLLLKFHQQWANQAAS